MDSSQTFWRRCSNCKNPIALGAKYWMCSVASCSKVRAPTQFCKPDCWAVHEEVAFHKNAWAVEHTAPKSPDVEVEKVAAPSKPPQPAPVSRQPPVSSTSPSPSVASPSVASPSVASPSAASPSAASPSAASPSAASPSRPIADGGDDNDVLVVVSRLKDLIKAESNGMSTSDQVVELFSDHVRRLADLGVESARKNGRKTMLDRDIPRLAPPAAKDVLIVVSKLKEYVRRKADLRTSEEVPLAMSHELRRLALFAIENARKDGRKTVMGRDVP